MEDRFEPTEEDNFQADQIQARLSQIGWLYKKTKKSLSQIWKSFWTNPQIESGLRRIQYRVKLNWED